MVLRISCWTSESYNPNFTNVSYFAFTAGAAKLSQFNAAGWIRLLAAIMLMFCQINLKDVIELQN